MGYYVYKYVLDNQIIYIGKNDTNLQDRIIQHQREEKFKPYMEADIYYIELKNKAETSGLEKLLINKYKPILNIVDKYKKIYPKHQDYIIIIRRNYINLNFSEIDSKYIELMKKIINKKESNNE